MFTATTIMIAFVGMLASKAVLLLAVKYKWRGVLWAAGMGLIVSSGFCVAAGIFLLLGWQDPLAGASAVQLSKAAVRARGRGGILILAIRFWPFVLIGSGGFCFYHALIILWYSRR